MHLEEAGGFWMGLGSTSVRLEHHPPPGWCQAGFPGPGLFLGLGCSATFPVSSFRTFGGSDPGSGPQDGATVAAMLACHTQNSSPQDPHPSSLLLPHPQLALHAGTDRKRHIPSSPNRLHLASPAFHFWPGFLSGWLRDS